MRLMKQSLPRNRTRTCSAPLLFRTEGAFLKIQLQHVLLANG